MIVAFASRLAFPFNQNFKLSKTNAADVRFPVSFLRAALGAEFSCILSTSREPLCATDNAADNAEEESLKSQAFFSW
eukprot:CAMPEP_0178744612 /NCGR_PEP_ID=MMETSP0744-20121128/6866_1 /TAXON_ID=913974 /ORGANISM="Nitzschia punctata, Strain CCMP561" /LENGTH=76 /DNA_ID=CAMNT_0020397763 /DNA_START=358 /DNA_END=585 /DNA_ORIENTATION=-